MHRKGHKLRLLLLDIKGIIFERLGDVKEKLEEK